MERSCGHHRKTGGEMLMSLITRHVSHDARHAYLIMHEIRMSPYPTYVCRRGG